MRSVRGITQAAEMHRYLQHGIVMSQVLESVTKAKGEDAGVFHIALAYVMQKTRHVFPIVGGRALGHMHGNIARV